MLNSRNFYFIEYSKNLIRNKLQRIVFLPLDILGSSANLSEQKKNFFYLNSFHFSKKNLITFNISLINKR